MIPVNEVVPLLLTLKNYDGQEISIGGVNNGNDLSRSVSKDLR